MYAQGAFLRPLISLRADCIERCSWHCRSEFFEDWRRAAARLGDRDEGKIAHYAEIFDNLPPIEINQHNELIDGWHRILAAERADRSAIEFTATHTVDDDDLLDLMYAANLKHGVQYNTAQRRSYGVKLHLRGQEHPSRKLSVKLIASQAGVNQATVYRWTKEVRDNQKQERQDEIGRMLDEGRTQQQIADDLEIDPATVSRNLHNSQMRKLQDRRESEAEPTIETEAPRIADEIEPEAETDPILGSTFPKTPPEDEAQLHTSGPETQAVREIRAKLGRLTVSLRWQQPETDGEESGAEEAPNNI